jgi:ribonuclease-3
MDIGSYVILGRGEDSSHGRTKPSILSDTLEAVIGAVYLDGGITSAREFVTEKIIRPFLSNTKIEHIDDYKSRLQMIIQQNPNARVEYHTISNTGPAHDKTFRIKVEANGRVLGYGSGKSKKEAEQMAARDALRKCF